MPLLPGGGGVDSRYRISNCYYIHVLIIMAVIPIICDHTAGRGQIFWCPGRRRSGVCSSVITELFKRILKQMHAQTLNVCYIYLHLPSSQFYGRPFLPGNPWPYRKMVADVGGPPSNWKTLKVAGWRPPKMSEKTSVGWKVDFGWHLLLLAWRGKGKGADDLELDFWNPPTAWGLVIKVTFEIEAGHIGRLFFSAYVVLT